MSNLSKVIENLVLIQSSKGTEELSIKDVLTMFESQNKIVCGICSHDDLTNDDSVKKLGEFYYDQFSLGDDLRTQIERTTKYQILYSLAHNNLEASKRSNVRCGN